MTHDTSTNWATKLSRHYKPSSGQANLFAVIIYTNAHAYIAKVLADQFFWNALDEISGPQWAIFATRAAKGKLDYPATSPNVIGFLVAVWKEPTKNKGLLKAFELDDTQRLPLLVIFAEDEKGRIEQTCVKLSDSSLESAYDSLRSILGKVAEAIKQIDRKNLRAGARAFYAVQYAVKDYNEKQIMKRMFQFIPQGLGLLKALVGSA